MMCNWESFLSILPSWLRREGESLKNTSLQELRLRINAPPELNLGAKQLWLDRRVTKEDLAFCINAASRYSPWAAATIANGFLTVAGGHRIGICGECVCRDGAVAGIREVRSVNIRIARDLPGIARSIHPGGSALLLGAPGWGKTTLLRDLARQLSEKDRVCVVDQRCELFPEGMNPGRRMDILSGCSKSEGISMVLRSMGPDWIALDEITAQEDTNAVLQAAGCGVKLLATAHAASVRDLHRRPIYAALLHNAVFQTYVILNPDQTFRTERVEL